MNYNPFCTLMFWAFVDSPIALSVLVHSFHQDNRKLLHVFYLPAFSGEDSRLSESKSIKHFKNQIHVQKTVRQ